MILFMLEQQPVIHKSRRFLFTPSFHTHPAHPSDNMHPSYMVLCYGSILAFLTSKLLFRSFSRMAFLVVDQSCLCLQRLIACFANILFSPFLSMHCAFVPNDRGGNQHLLADFTFKNLCQFVLTGPSFNSEALETWEPLRKTWIPPARTGASELETRLWGAS